MGAAPPLVGVAVNVTLWPVHIDVLVDVILTDGVTDAFTVTEMLLDVAGLPVTPERFEAITQVMASDPAASVVVVNVEEVAPLTAVPFTFH